MQQRVNDLRILEAGSGIHLPSLFLQLCKVDFQQRGIFDLTQKCPLA